MKAHEFRHEMTTTSAVFGRMAGIEVIFEGDQAATDGKTIYLPAMPDDVELSTLEVQAMRGFVDHEAGHIRHSDMPLIINSYKEWEKNQHPGLRQLHNYLEDIWMEAKVMDDYVGSMKNFRSTSELVNKRELDGMQPELQERLTSFNVDSAGMAIALEGRKGYSNEHAAKLRELVDPKVLEHSKKWVEEVHKCKSSADVIKVAKAVYELIEQDPKLESDPEDFQPQEGEGNATGGKGDGEPTDQQVPVGAKEGKQQQQAMQAMQEAIKSLVPGIGKPEGDYKGAYRVYTTKYDDTYSLKNTGDFKAFKSTNTYEYLKSKNKVQANVATMKNKLRTALLSKQRRDWDFGREIGKLDSKRLVYAYGGKPNVFKARVDRDEENTAIQILVDLSGSMHGRKVELAQECAIAVAECFEGTSLSYQITGFDAAYRDYDVRAKAHKTDKPYHRIEANRMFNFKPFETSLRQARPALGSITETGGHNNADRDAILWCLNTLKKREEKRKILLVLSDGHPANDTVNVGHKELTRHAKDAIAWGSKQGIECIGIGIMDPTVEQIYPQSVVVHDISDLSMTAFSQFTRLLMKGK